MIIDGRNLSIERLNNLKLKIEKGNLKIKLVAILVDGFGSDTYVRMKAKKAQEVGIQSEIIKLSRDISEEELIKKVEQLNSDEGVTGILVQLPLPKVLNLQKVLNAISPNKDVDGLRDNSPFLPATVKAVLSLLPPLENKIVVVLGQGKLVGKPLSDELEKKAITVIRCDEHTSDLKSATLQGDVLVVATGVEKLITADMVKLGAVVIDCGAPNAEVDFEAVFEVASAITPVPGGVGPLTIVSLLENTLEAATIQSNTHT